MSDTSKEIFEKYWPYLQEEDWEITSPWTDEYNCFAFAAGDEERWWAPSTNPRYYWPEGVPLDRTVDSLMLAFATVGFTECDDRALEHGYEKIAIYVDESGRPTHAAKQLENGHWSSKLGEYEDIRHQSLSGIASPEGLAPSSECWAYGTVVGFMKRPRQLNEK